MHQISSFLQQSTSLQTVRLLFGSQVTSTSTNSIAPGGSPLITGGVAGSNVAFSPAFHDVLLSFAVEAGTAVARHKVEGTVDYDPSVKLSKEWESWTTNQKSEFVD